LSADPDPGTPVEHPVDLDEFCDWLRGCLGLATLPEPADRLHEDLSLDDFQLLELAVELEAFVAGVAKVGSQFYRNTLTVRDLHLYYLLIASAPIGTDL
jgi:hypothetical protein